MQAPTLLCPAADAERSTSAPSCCQGGGPRHARLRLRVAAVPLRALDSGRCVALGKVSAPEECRSLSHQRNAGYGGRASPCPFSHLCSADTDTVHVNRCACPSYPVSEGMRRHIVGVQYLRNAYVTSPPIIAVIRPCIALSTYTCFALCAYSAIHVYVLSCIGIAVVIPNLAKQRDDGPLPRPEFLIGSLPKGIDFGFLQAEL